jgi:hypothetical protein
MKQAFFIRLEILRNQSLFMKKNDVDLNNLAVGIALGIVFGVALGNIGLGIALGTAFGLLFGSSCKKK